MSLNEHDQSPRTGHIIEPREMTQKQRASSSASQSRLARKAAAMAQMNALELASTKAEMERLREENRSLRGIIQQLESLEVADDSDDNGPQSVDGDSETGVNASRGSSISPAPSISIQSDESNDTVLKHSTPDSFGTYPAPQGVLGEFAVPLRVSVYRSSLTKCDSLCKDYSQTESEAIQLAQAIFDGNTADCSSDPEFSSTAWKSKSNTTGSLGRLPTRFRPLYEIPDDFDPDNEDYNLSDVETVTSDEVLQAWGISEQPIEEEEIASPPAGENDVYEPVDEQDGDNEEGWEGDIDIQALNNILI